MADLVRREFTEEAQKAVILRLRANAGRNGPSLRSPSSSTPVPCAMLDDRGTCTAHAARPLRCRGYHSLSATKCDAALNGQDDVAVPVDPHSCASMRGVQAGLSGAIRNSRRDGDYYDLHSAVLCALETPDSRRRWENGEDVFAACASTVAVPDDVWIAPQEDGSVVKLRRACCGQEEPHLQLVLIGEDRVIDLGPAVNNRRT